MYLLLPYSRSIRLASRSQAWLDSLQYSYPSAKPRELVAHALICIISTQAYMSQLPWRSSAILPLRKSCRALTCCIGDDKKGANLFKVRLTLRKESLWGIAALIVFADPVRAMSYSWSGRGQQDRPQSSRIIWAQDRTSRRVFIHRRKQEQGCNMERRHTGMLIGRSE